MRVSWLLRTTRRERRTDLSRDGGRRGVRISQVVLLFGELAGWSVCWTLLTMSRDFYGHR